MYVLFSSHLCPQQLKNLGSPHAFLRSQLPCTGRTYINFSCCVRLWLHTGHCGQASAVTTVFLKASLVSWVTSYNSAKFEVCWFFCCTACCISSLCVGIVRAVLNFLYGLHRHNICLLQRQLNSYLLFVCCFACNIAHKKSPDSYFGLLIIPEAHSHFKYPEVWKKTNKQDIKGGKLVLFRQMCFLKMCGGPKLKNLFSML